MLLLDITIVNIALPAIQRDLHASFTDLQWVIDAYALTLAALLLVSGSLSDLLGRRAVFVTGLVLFSAASLSCGLAGSPLALTLSRAAQGVGGAMLFATSLALIAGAFQGRDRGIAFGIYGATIGAAVAIGPLVGGALTDGFGWQWIFFVNVPIGIAAVFVTLAKVDESKDPNPAGIDWLGAITFSAALFMLVFALIRGNDEGWSSTLIVSLLIGSFLALVAFVFIELRQEHPLFDLSLFRNRTFVGASIVAFALSSSMFAMFLYITLYIENVLGYTPFQTGLRFLPITLISFVVAPISGRLSSRFPMRAFLGGGLVLIGAGLLLMHGVKADSHWTTLLAGTAVAGAGIGMINPTLATTAVSVVEPQRSGMASGINNTFRQVGIATGIAGLGAIFEGQIRDKLHASLDRIPQAAAHVSQIAKAVSSGGVEAVAARAPGPVREPVVSAAKTAFVGGINELFIVGAVVAFAGAAFAFILVRQRDIITAPQAEAAAAAA
jgi:EmrB/QacA subfamily drug resistance transporter